MKEREVVRTIGGKSISNITEFLAAILAMKKEARVKAGVLRSRQEEEVVLFLP